MHGPWAQHKLGPSLIYNCALHYSKWSARRALGAISHGHVLLDPERTYSGGCFISVKIFRALNFIIQESKIVTSCKGRFDEQKF